VYRHTLPVLVAGLLSLASGAAWSQARIIGVVTDPSGAAVAHGFVEALPRIYPDSGGTAGDRINPWTPTDDAGRFSISVPAGRYRIRAKDEANGYPDPSYWLNADATAIFPEISVGAEDVLGVRVVLGLKGGVLSGELIDQASRSPIVRGKITLRDARNPVAFVEVFSDKSGRFQLAIPSKPITISGSAAGYAATNFAGGAEVTLSAGEHREIVVELQHH